MEGAHLKKIVQTIKQDHTLVYVFNALENNHVLMRHCLHIWLLMISWTKPARSWGILPVTGSVPVLIYLAWRQASGHQHARARRGLR